jgi:hypothetical protein
MDSETLLASYRKKMEKYQKMAKNAEDANDELSAIYYRGLVTSIKIQVRYMAESMNLSKI